jgi:uncharacterized protein YdcH (DUF465 family)
MKKSIKTITVLLAVGLISCSNENYKADTSSPYESKVSGAYEETSEAEMEETNVLGNETLSSENHQRSISSVAASIENDKKMRFIRKAQLKYKTKSVRNTTYYLEQAVIGLGGIVTNTNLYSEIGSIKKIAVNKDSSLKITTYQMNNNMTIRIPNNKLDSLLKLISTSVLFLDERIITANEISLKELKNNMERIRLAEHHNKLGKVIKNKSDKINKVVDAHESLLHKKRLEDEAILRNLELDYEVEYSTVQITMYQASSVDKDLIENELNIDEFQPSFFAQLLESLYSGWNALLYLIIQLANLWFLILLVVVGVITYKRRK